MADFPLNQWSTCLRPISRDDRELCEAQMALYAYKQGDEPNGPDWNRLCADLGPPSSATIRVRPDCAFLIGQHGRLRLRELFR